MGAPGGTRTQNSWVTCWRTTRRSAARTSGVADVDGLGRPTRTREWGTSDHTGTVVKSRRGGALAGQAALTCVKHAACRGETVVRLFPDYANTVLWFPYPVDYADSRLDDDLVADLRDWEDSYDAGRDKYRWRSRELERAFESRGVLLAPGLQMPWGTSSPSTMRATVFPAGARPPAAASFRDRC